MNQFNDKFHEDVFIYIIVVRSNGLRTRCWTDQQHQQNLSARDSGCCGIVFQDVTWDIFHKNINIEEKYSTIDVV